MVPILRHFPRWHGNGTIFVIYLQIGTIFDLINGHTCMRFGTDDPSYRVKGFLPDADYPVAGFLLWI
jgi:hypothetical protein